MKRLTRLSVLLVVLAACAGLVVAQGFEVKPNPPAPLRPGVSEIFVSTDGRFSISLPKEVSGFAGHDAGMSFTWKVKEGVFNVDYMDVPQPVEQISKQFFELIRQRMAESKVRLQVVSERDISLDGHPGHEFHVEADKGFGISRIYLVGNRGYQVLVMLPLTKKDEEQAAIKILDSFKLLTEAEVAAELKRKAAEAAPPGSLPQEPVAPKAKSDAVDQGLKGKVKTVFTESEDLSGTWAVAGRKPSSMIYFNERGNFTKREAYDYRGNLSDITVYGYLDGARVALSKAIRYEYDPPPMMMAPPAPGVAGERKADPRYSSKYSYKYDDKGRLTEELLYLNDGTLDLSYIYKYQDDRREELVYDRKGALNQKYSVTFDEKGNEKEKTVFEVKDNSVEEKFSYAYEFDQQGNWIKRTTSMWTTKDGKSGFTPYSINYRTITYY